MAYTPYTPVGSNLTDLGRLLEAGEARSASENMQRMSLMFQNAQKKADLESRRAENEADRKLKYFEVDQRKALQTRSLDMENERLKAEAERWFAGHGLKEREVSAYEKQLGAPDPRVARENAITKAQREELNALANNAASEAQRQLDVAFEKLSVANTGWNMPFLGKDAAGLKAQGRQIASQKIEQDELPKIRASLMASFGEAAQLVDFVPYTDGDGIRRYKAVGKTLPVDGNGVPGPTRPSVPGQQFFGPPLTPPAERPFTLIPEGYPAQPAMQFPTREALDAFSGRGTNAAPVLRYNPQTGTFE